METEQEFNTTMKIVESILVEDERTRNSDHWLIIETLRRMGFKIYINYEDINNLPAFETITRCRRKIQSENPNLKADEQIQEARDNKESIIQEIMRPKNYRAVEVTNYIRPKRGIEVFE